MKKIIYTAIALGSLAVLSANQENLQAEQVTSFPTWNSVIVNQNQSIEEISPKITSLEINTQKGMIYCYLETPIPGNYYTSLSFGDSIFLGNQLEDDNGNIIGYSISLSYLAQSEYTTTEISKKIFIRAINTTTSEVIDFPVDYQELKDVINNIGQVYTVNPLYSGDTAISGTASPNTKIYITTFTDLTQEGVIAQGQSDENGNFNISLSEPISGYSNFSAMTIGKYYDSDSESIVSQPKDINENLFLNPTFENQAKGWITTGAQQTLTPSADTQVNFKSLAPDVHMGAVQYKVTQSNQKMKMSMDVRINSIYDSSYGPLVILGNVYPGGAEIGPNHKEFTFSKTDLDKWIHIEYDFSTEGMNLPTGFTTSSITDMDVRNVKLTPLS